MKVQDLEHFIIDLYDVKDQLKQHIYSRSLEAFAQGDRARDAIASADQLDARRKFMREAFIASIGGIPPSDAPLHAKITGTVQGKGCIVEKVMFQSRPKQWVTANMYIPEGIEKPTGAVLHLCGHSHKGKHADLYQTVSQHLVRAGLIVFTTDPIGQGERLSYYDRDTGKLLVEPSVREHEHVGKQCLPLGDQLARYFLHDAMRAIDYLCTRPEVDRDKIGVTGCSGGGTQTSMVMLCDPRIAAAAPAAFIMNRESYMHAGQAQDAEQIWTGMTKLGFDHEDILMAIAPKPLLVLAASYDFFPIEGTRRTVERTKRFWEMFGKADNFEYFEDASRHTYSVPMVKKAAAFFSKHLLGKPLDCTWEGIAPIDPKQLWCTQTGQVRGDYADVRGVHEENKERLAELEQAAAAKSDARRKEEALAWLRGKVYGERKPCLLNPRRLALGKLENGLNVETLLWWSQKGLFNHAFLFQADAAEKRKKPLQGSRAEAEQRAYEAREESERQQEEHALPPVTIALWPRGTKRLAPRIDWIRQTCLSGRAVLVLDVSGDGAVMPNSISPRRGMHDFYGTLHKFSIDLFWLDDSLAALRTFDVLRALDLIDSFSEGRSRDTRLYAEGRFSLYAQLAEMLDDRLKQVEIVDGIESISEWVRSRYYDNLDSEGIVMPGMLKWFDLPDLRRWKA